MLNAASGDIELRGTATEIAWAKEIRVRVAAEFDRFGHSVTASINRFRALDRAEINSLLLLIEEHRAKVLGSEQAAYFIDNWQDPVERVERTINADERWKAITQARTARQARATPAAPVRYMGFEDIRGVRVYRFGRLPSHEGMEIFAVNIPVEMFLKHKISFQDGPAMCSAIMAASPEPKDHWVTDDDSLEFIARRPVKPERKPFRQKQTVPNQ